MLTRRQAQILINHFNSLFINQQFQMVALVVNNVISPFDGNINPVDSQGIKLYFQAKKQIYKETDGIYISVSNSKDIIDHFPILDNKYVWRCLSCMLDTGAGANNIFSQVEQPHISDMHTQAFGYFGLKGIGSVPSGSIISTKIRQK